MAVVISMLAPGIVWARDGLTIGSSAMVVGTEGRGLRVRGGPGMGHRIATTLNEGTTVQILAGPVGDGDGDSEDWYQISVNGSATGWALERYLAQAAASSNGPNGGQRAFVVKMTAYANGVGGISKEAKTASGTLPRWGVVAVDPKVIPIGSAVQIDGYDGVFVAEDTGSAIKGAALDLWHADPSEARRYGTQYRRLTVLREGPER